ncbi:Type-1 glutamine synthetase 2 [Leucoagaricus sp. SymC.cos]|nr:Type-1 glutamine synthetase 2 [Leucoagaricus sp. SymC.cos]
MASTYGSPKTYSELADILARDTKVKVAVDGVLRGKFLSKDKFLSAAKTDGFGFCSVVFGWDMHDQVYSQELLISNKRNGYRDLLAWIDLTTYRRIPWENHVPFFLVTFRDPDSKAALAVDPRGVVARAEKRAIQELGYLPYAGVEYEYFNFKETPQSAAEKGFVKLNPLTPGMHGYSMLRTQLNNEYFQDIIDKALNFEVNVEGHHTETGPGVYETALAYTNALRMADNAILFKYLVKSIGMKHGIIPSFMAKPWGNLPGCSGHTHVSLRDESGRNIFAVGKEELKTGRMDAANDDTKFISRQGELFLAGILEGLPDVLPMLVPTINGYKRLVGGEAFWAPNAVTYGYDSRQASIRIIAPPSVAPEATRFEIRVPGADMNPYYSLGAIFLLGIRGIKKELQLKVPPISQLTPSDKSQNKVQLLPKTLEEATLRMMRPDSIARELDVFGNEFVDHFGGTRLHEVKVWNEAVTSWEVERYLELA